MEHLRHNRDHILTDLRSNVVEIAFIAMPGDTNARVLKCSLMEKYLPQNYNYQADLQFHADHPTLLAVWDVGNKKWQAFDMSMVRYVQALDHLMFD